MIENTDRKRYFMILQRKRMEKEEIDKKNQYQIYPLAIEYQQKKFDKIWKKEYNWVYLFY